MKHASISLGDESYYAFLCQGKSGIVVLINDPGVKEYEFKMGKSSQMGALLYNLLMNGK